MLAASYKLPYELICPYCQYSCSHARHRCLRLVSRPYLIVMFLSSSTCKFHRHNTHRIASSSHLNSTVHFLFCQWWSWWWCLPSLHRFSPSLLPSPSEFLFYLLWKEPGLSIFPRNQPLAALDTYLQMLPLLTCISRVSLPDFF